MSDKSVTLPVFPSDAEGSFLFLSYNNLDHEHIQEIQKALSFRGIATFLDRDRLNPGLSWFDGLQEAINNASAVAIFIGKHGLGTWQKREMEFALDRQARAEKSGVKFPVVPVVLPWADLQKAPGFLMLNSWVDLRSGLTDSTALDLLAQVVRGNAIAPRPISDILCPYRALLAFREEDAPLFQGREIFSEKVLGKTLAHQLVTVVGASGSGKSSVVQAGLMPLLRRESAPAWDAVVFTPGKHPFHNLAAALVPLWEKEIDQTQLLIKAGELGDSWSRGVPLETAFNQAVGQHQENERLLLIVDQFEELFTLTPESERLPFVNSLLEAATTRAVTVLLTLRADFYGQMISLSRELSDSVQQGLINIGSMTREELCRSVEIPANLSGVEFETGLVNRILDHVENQPGSLPLLEFALTELWKNSDNRVLTHRAYDEIGGVEGAISKRAEEVFENLSRPQREVAVRLLTRLVRVAAPNEGSSDTRQRVTMSNFDETMRLIAQSFVQARLLVVDRDRTTNEETIELAHEALILRWTRLHELLNQDREFMLWRRRLRVRLSEWQSKEGGDDAALLQGAALAEGRRWLKDRQKDLFEDEKRFIKSSFRRDPKSDTWGDRFDMTNYAIVITSATVMFVLSSAGNVHFVILLTTLLVGFLAFMEASLYLLWTKAQTEDFSVAEYQMPQWRALGLRLRRNYLWIFGLLFGVWILKLYLYPLPARDFASLEQRAAIGAIPGWLIIILHMALYGGCFTIALASIRPRNQSTEGGKWLIQIDSAETKAKAKQWLDMINYAILTTATTLLYVFNTQSSPHFIIVISYLFIGYFWFREASYYRSWVNSSVNNRVALMSVWGALGVRLWRNYLWIFLILLISWLVKVYLNPLPARDFYHLADRATVGLIPGWLIIVLSLLSYVGLLSLALATILQTDPKDQLKGISLAEAKQWLERASTYAVATIAITILSVFNSLNNPYLIVVIISPLIAFVLVRGGNYYRLWTSGLKEDLAISTYTLVGWQAVGLRLRRIYTLSFTVLFACSALKNYTTPLTAQDFTSFADRASVGTIPGEAIIIVSTLFYFGVLIFALTSFSSKKSIRAIENVPEAELH